MANKPVASSLGLLALGALPFVLSDYRVFQLTMVMISSIALLGLNLLTGYGGQISLGHGAFYGIGAYTTAILVHELQVPYGLTIPCAGIACALLGFLFGWPALRLEGIYLALATFALGVVLPQILKYRGIEGWTGGVQGITLTKPEAPFGLPLSADHWLYYLCLAIALLSFVVARNLVRGPTGRAIVAIRDHRIAASSAGIDTAMYTSITFGISAMYAGIAGSLGALTVQFVGPDSFSIYFSIGLLVGIVVGGVATISGAIYGALFIQFVPNIADDVSKAAPWAIYGIVLIACAHVMPSGVAGWLERLSAPRKVLESTRAERMTLTQEEP
ncbi:branched-chain amino acid ABC transporter permease [Pendulispora albinea]|uniref:Branched-chain amino acid ABC transporter permease n=1 Tax=Pendulispora albinea TaxID=2741071 RepID=A0ABZ2M7M3_9BACT